MQRRDFIRNGSLTAASVLLHPALGSSTGSETYTPLRTAIIGCGDRGKGVAHVMAQLPELYTISAVCDVLDFRLQDALKLPAMQQAKAYTNHQQLLAEAAVDAVLVAVPLHLHFPLAKDVLASGRHLYLEKTMTYNIPQAQQLVQLAKKAAPLVVQIGHQYRSSPLYYKVKEMIQSGYLGKVSHVDCRWDRNASWRRPVPQPGLERQINWRMYREYSGGLIAELLSHQIDFINWAFDTHPDEFFASGGIDIFKDGRETFDNVQATLRYRTAGFTASFGATCGNARDGFLFKIKGTRGTVSLLTDEGIYYPEKTDKEKGTVDGVTGATQIVWEKDGGTLILPQKTKDGTWYALKEFFEKVQSGGLPDSNVFTGARTAVCVHLANNALYSNQVLRWKAGYNFS